MLRRSFFKSLLGTALIPFADSTATPRRTLLLQESPLAGFQYHEGNRVWSELAIGDPLELRREPANPYDSRAVAVYWARHKLGYLPRVENTAVAQLMDRTRHLDARVCGLSEEGGPWQRLKIAVYLAT